MSKNLINGIIDAISSKDSEVLISKFDLITKRNELLFFFKPECFLNDEDYTKAIIEMSLNKFVQYEANICGAILLSGRTLDRFGIMDNHYGYINRMSKNASKLITDDEKMAIFKNLHIEITDKTNIYGGHEFLNIYKNFDENSLDSLWSSKKSLKLRSGLYFQKYSAEEEKFILINGFHPAQLGHFTKLDRKIVVLLLRSDNDWKILKDMMVGDTFPEQAVKDSIRGDLFSNKGKYNLKDVSIANNFVHLSAGPFEAFYEIDNFLKRLDITDFKLSEHNIYKYMVKMSTDEDNIKRSISNPSAQIGGREIDLFTYTENKNTEEAISDYMKYF
ncbi:MAG: nucleoside-diphosphate kinase [Desulfobacterales bacterium]|nr:nucleoside-diphosphate kinase [Desulfobacterales bacterium]